MRLVRDWHWPGIAALWLAGCSLPVDCTQVEVPAVVLTVRDPVSGAVITEGSSARLLAGAFQVGFGPHQLDGQRRALSLAAYAPAGRYGLAVSRAGYAEWDSVVTVEAGPGCPAVVSAEVTARPDRQ